VSGSGSVASYAAIRGTQAAMTRYQPNNYETIFYDNSVSADI
jgi:hypothetical protein